MLGFEGAHPGALHSERVDKRKCPNAEVQLRVDGAEENRSQETRPIRMMQPKLRHVHRDDPVQQPEDTTDARDDDHAGAEALGCAQPSSNRPGKRSR